jgi:outer membrane protein insertion porin family
LVLEPEKIEVFKANGELMKNNWWVIFWPLFAFAQSSSNEVVSVSSIEVTGNQEFTVSQIKAQLKAKVGKVSLQKLQSNVNDDQAVIKNLYFKRGFLNFGFGSEPLQTESGHHELKLHYQLREGPRFQIGNVDFAGELLFNRKELLKSIRIPQRKFFIYDVLMADLVSLNKKYRQAGYSKIQITPKTIFDGRNERVHIVFMIQK